jgi:hypothetical protein
LYSSLNSVAYSLKARTVESQQPAVTRQRPVSKNRGMFFFCTIRADGCAYNNGIRHAIAKQKLYINRGTVFSTRSVPKCYKQE